MDGIASGNSRRPFAKPQALGAPKRAARLPLALALFVAAGVAAAAVPTPAETPVKVVVSGRTSTLKSIRIVPTGQEIPPNFSGGKVKNTPGYSWYVSRHFAMKTDMPEKWAQDCLTWAELAYPQAVWVMGREPEGLDARRMVFAYGKTLESMREATYTDGGFRWSYSGGGVTFDFLRAAYNYPSGSLTYHKRDLVIHENLHLLQAVLTGTCYNTPSRFLEGVTYAFANHVYDAARKQLTVQVVDKPTVNNICDAALGELDRKFLTVRELMDDKGSGPIWGLYTQFMWTDPDRLMKWRLWRDELFRLGGRDLKANDERLMKDIYGDLDALEAQWRAWVAQRRSSFHYVDWGWEQDGQTLWSYGWPQKTAFSQTNVNLPLGERAAYEPLRMDYPSGTVPAHLVGTVRRGGDGPTVAAILDFSRNPDKGLCGLALGVVEDTGGAGKEPAAAGRSRKAPGGTPEQLNVYFQASKTLVIDGTALGLRKVEADVPAEFRSAMKADGHRAGLTVHVGPGALEATLRAGPAAGVQAFRQTLPLTAAARTRVLTCPSAVIAKEGYHGVTPLFDTPRRGEADLAKATPANRWHFAGDAELYRLYRAAWRLGKAAPPSLLNLRRQLAEAMDQDEDTQCGAVQAHARSLRQVVRDVRAVGDDALAQAATAELLGMSMELRFADEDAGTGPAGAAGPVGPPAASRPRLVAHIRGPVEGQATATVTFQAPQAAPVAPAELTVPAGKAAEAVWMAPLPTAASSAPAAAPAGDDVQTCRVQVRAEVQWEGMKLTLTDDKTLWPSVPRWWVVGPFENRGDATVDTPQPPEKAPIDLKATYAGKGRQTIQWQRCQRPADLPAGQELVLDFGKLLGGEPDSASAYALTYVESPADTDAVLTLGSDDGAVAWLNGRRVLTKLASRGYRSMEDTAPVRLRKGHNELLVKVTQTNGGWKMSAHLLDKSGQPLPGVTYTLDRP